MSIGRTRSVSGLGVFYTVCVKGTVLAITLLAAVPAQADSIKFFSGTTGYTGSFSGAGTVYQSIENNNTACAGGGAGNCSGNADVHAAANVAISFIGGITAAGSGGTGIGAWYDLSPNFGGMGVGPTSGTPSDADNIAGTDILHIHFNSSVQLTGVATLFDSGHSPFGASLVSGSTFLLSETLAGLSTGQTNFSTANTGLLNLASSQDFYFEENGTGNPAFYVSGLTFVSQGGGGDNPTPIPGAVWLFGTVIAGGAGYGRWRKKRKAAAVA